ncbi:hypothetical protein BOX15_Mlig011819g1, partial [Macrostomum lignano]
KMSDNSASAGNAISSFDQLRQECELTVQSVCDSLANRLPADCDLAKMQSAVLADFTEFLANITLASQLKLAALNSIRPMPGRFPTAGWHGDRRWICLDQIGPGLSVATPPMPTCWPITTGCVSTAPACLMSAAICALIYAPNWRKPMLT